MIAQAAAKRERETTASDASASVDGAEPTFDGRHVVWDDEARVLLDGLDDSVRRNVALRAEKLAHRDTGGVVTAAVVAQVTGRSGGPRWSEAAAERIERVPAGFMRERSRARVVEYARSRGLTEITLAACEAGLARARGAMMSMVAPSDPTAAPQELPWTPAAEARIASVPEGFMRDLTRQRVCAMARSEGLDRVTLEVVERKYAGWEEGSAQVDSILYWTPEAEARIQRIPPFVRGMVIKEIERRAIEQGKGEVGVDVIEGATSAWRETGGFHP